MDRAHGVYITSGKQIEVNEVNKFEEKTWWEQRNEMIRLPVSSWVKIKAFIIKICKKYKCDQDVSDWDRSIETIDKMYELK